MKDWASSSSLGSNGSSRNIFSSSAQPMASYKWKKLWGFFSNPTIGDFFTLLELATSPVVAGFS